jgi:hypothetical protein
VALGLSHGKKADTMLYNGIYLFADDMGFVSAGNPDIFVSLSKLDTIL